MTWCLSVHPADMGPVFRRCWLSRDHVADHQSEPPASLDRGDTWTNEDGA